MYLYKDMLVYEMYTLHELSADRPNRSIKQASPKRLKRELQRTLLLDPVVLDDSEFSRDDDGNH